MLRFHLSPAAPRVAATRRVLVLAPTLSLLAFTAGHAQATSGASASPVAVTRLSGEVRTRSEWDHAGTRPADVSTGFRARLGLTVDAAPGARLVFQVQDSRLLGAEGSPGGDVLDLHQGYLELTRTGAAATLAARIGRQEIALGNERLVGPVAWSNSGRTFDAVRVSAGALGRAAWATTAFAAILQDRGWHATGASTTAPDHVLAGAFSSRVVRALTVEATALYDGHAQDRTHTDLTRTTADLRLRAARLPWLPMQAELEGAVQGGAGMVTASGARESVRAWLAAARLGMTAADARTSVTVGADILSGDRQANDGHFGAFSTLYATNHPFYGLMDVIGDPATTTKDRGLVDALAVGSRAVGARTSLRGEVHRFTLATGQDRTLGWEGDLVAPTKLGSAVGLDLGYSLFRAGSAAGPLGLGAPGAIRQWAYAQVRVGF